MIRNAPYRVFTEQDNRFISLKGIMDLVIILII